MVQLNQRLFKRAFTTATNGHPADKKQQTEDGCCKQTYSSRIMQDEQVSRAMTASKPKIQNTKHVSVVRTIYT